MQAPRTVSCGCCAGIGTAPDRDRCTCHFHQDMTRGLRVHVCAYHAEHGHPRVTSPPRDKRRDRERLEQISKGSVPL